tara:strand:+ start:428 stop:1918 length:1491 start_codon:yes stop_codon:yes gene_type:complete
MTKLKELLLVVWLCFCYSSLKADCTNTTIGLCTPGTEEVIVESITEETEQDGTGITTIITTTTDVTTTTITNEDSGDILDGNNGYVLSSKEGDMDTDWGGQGPASMPSGSSCYGLGTDKCAQITGSGNSTSTMGVTGMGTTFIQTIDISDLTIDKGGQVKYTISVDKQDSQDRIYMHITGSNGNTSVFSGTDILSETGVTSGYQQYSGNFDFAGSLNRLIVEVGGRDINLAIGPLFDDVSINVLYNVVNTIVTQEITTVEMFVALNTDVSTEIIDVVETIFEFNEPIQDAPIFTLEPVNETVEDFSYETVEVELEVDFDMEVEMTEVEINVEPETEEPTMDIQEAANEEPDMENSTDSEPNETESDSEATEESPMEDESSDEQETVQQEEEQEPTEEPKQEVKQEQKQKAATKIVKKMGDKGRYEVNNQIKTLIVMQVLANSKSFFVDTQLSEIQGFFTDVELPDTTISDNNIANYFMTIDSDNTFNQIVDSQYNR